MFALLAGVIYVARANVQLVKKAKNVTIEKKLKIFAKAR